MDPGVATLLLEVDTTMVEVATTLVEVVTMLVELVTEVATMLVEVATMLGEATEVATTMQEVLTEVPEVATEVQGTIQVGKRWIGHGLQMVILSATIVVVLVTCLGIVHKGGHKPTWWTVLRVGLMQ